MAVIPKFSIRQMLLAMIVVAVFSAIAAGAFRGNSIAVGLVIGVFALIVPIVTLTIGYWAAYSLALILKIVFSSRTSKSVIGGLLISAGWAALSPTAMAQAPTMPPGKSGYVVTIDDNYPEANQSYRPIRITVETKPLLPVKKNTRFNVVIKNNYYGRSAYALSSPLMLESGNSSATVELYFPIHPAGGSSYGTIVVERGGGNGQYEPGRDLFYQQLQTNYNSFDQPSTLWVSNTISRDNGARTECWDAIMSSPTGKKATVELDATKQVKPTGLVELSKCFPNTTSDTLFAVSANAPIQSFQVSAMIHCVHPAELPQHWIGLSSVQQIMISRDDLKAISTKHELQRDALEKWVAAGGSLVVYEVGDKLADADDLLPLLLGRQRSSEIGRVQPVWQRASEKLTDERGVIASSYRDPEGPFIYPNDDGTGYREGSSDDLNETNAWQGTGTTDDLKNELKYVQTPHVNGRIFAIGGAIEKWRKADWIELENAIALAGNALSDQLGQAASDGGTSGFNVPGVGEPPLVAFQVLISLFILVAGPLMYGVLRKTRQMQLLFLLVPLLSLSACLGLLGFAIFVDGFSAWGRVQSVTWLDQQTESAVSHSRTAYYCGLQPQPYSYSLDTVTRLPAFERVVPELNIQQRSQALLFTGGNMRARTPHQVVSTRSYQTKKKLRWLPSRTPKSGPATDQDPKADEQTTDFGSFRNQLGANVRYVVARTDGGWLVVENLPDEGIVPAKLVVQSTVDARLAQLSTSLSPQYQSRYSQRYGYSVATAYDGRAPLASAEHEFIERLRARQGTKLLDQPNTYIAILDSFPAIDPQIEAVNYKQQLHVIIGKW